MPRAIAALFSGPQDLQHVVEMLKLREFYRHLSNPADPCDQAANVICDIVATMISSRAFRPAVALAVTAVAEFSGPFIFGVAVAKTIGNDIIAPGTISLQVIVVALVTACGWNLFTRFVGIPSRSSRALIGALVGAVAVAASWRAIQVAGLLKALLPLFVSPVIGLSAGYLLTKLVFFLAQ